MTMNAQERLARNRALERAKQELHQGNIIAAIREYRTFADCGIRRAVDAIRAIERKEKPWPKEL